MPQFNLGGYHAPLIRASVRELTRLAALAVALAVISCGEPTGPTGAIPEAVQSFAMPVQPFAGSSPPNYSGSWRGEYLLAQCRASSPALCKDAPKRAPIRLQLSQSGSSLSGTIEFLGRTSAFQGFITSELGIAGVSNTDIYSAVRLVRSEESFVGFIAEDTYREGQVIMSKKYDLVTPLRMD